MPDVSRGDPTGGLTATQRAAADAELSIISIVQSMRQAWATLAERLYYFKQSDQYQELGYDSFNEWMASPHINLSQSWVYKLIQMYREFVIKGGLDVSEVGDAEPACLYVTVPAVQRGWVPATKALADAEALSRTDLTIMYSISGGTIAAAPPAPAGPGAGASIKPSGPVMVVCSHCGTYVSEEKIRERAS